MTLEAIKSTTPLRAPKQKPFRRYATERAIARNAERHLRADRGRGATLQEIKAGIDLQAAKARASQEARLSDYLHGRELRRLFFHDRIKLPVEIVKGAEKTLRRQGGELGQRGPGQRTIHGLHRLIAYAEVRQATRTQPAMFA